MSYLMTLKYDRSGFSLFGDVTVSHQKYKKGERRLKGSRNLQIKPKLQIKMCHYSKHFPSTCPKDNGTCQLTISELFKFNV